MAQVLSRITIRASADAIWQVISDFGAACRYLAMVDDCSVAGQGIGALRTLTSADGSMIVERLEATDVATRTVKLRPVDRHALRQLPDYHVRA